MSRSVRHTNRWIKGYDIAISYSRSQLDYVRLLDRQLMNTFNREDVFFDKAPEIQSGLSGAPLATELPFIVKNSKLSIIVLGHDYEEKPWPWYELQHILTEVANTGNFDRLYIIREDGVEIPHPLDAYSCCPETSLGIEFIIKGLVERVKGIKQGKQRASEKIEYQPTSTLFRLLDRHVPLSKYYFDNKKIVCNANGETVEGTCMAAEVAKALAAAIGVKQKIARVSRIIHHLRCIEILQFKADKYKEMGQTEKIMFRKCMASKCQQLLDEFMRHKVCDEDGNYYSEIRQPEFEEMKVKTKEQGIMSKIKLLVQPRIFREHNPNDKYVESEPVIKDEDKEIQKVVLESKLVRRLKGFLEHHANDKYTALNFLDLISYFLNVEKNKEIPDEFGPAVSEFCIESGKIADIIWKQSAIPDRIVVGKWSKEHLCASSESVDQHSKLFAGKIAQYSQFLIENARLERVGRYQ